MRLPDGGSSLRERHPAGQPVSFADRNVDHDGKFHRLPAPSEEDVEKLLTRLIPKLRRKLASNDDSNNSDDDLIVSGPAFDKFLAAALGSMIVL